MAQSIFSTPNQPMLFTPSTDDCGCGRVDQCQLVVPGQQIYAQLTINPLLEIDVCNNSLGENLVTNGDFATGDLTGWTAGAGWTYSAGGAVNNGNNNSLTQTLAITNATPYLVTFTLQNYISGTLKVLLGGVVHGTSFTANGEYGFIIFAGAGTDIDFDSDTVFRGGIDNITCQEITNCWDTDRATWNVSETGACHATGNTNTLTNLSTAITSGKYYHFTFVVSASTAGGVTLRADTAAIGAVTSGNGTFHRWGISDGTLIVLAPSSDFDGCISEVTALEYCDSYGFHLTTADGAFVEDVTSYFELEEDVFNLTNFSMDDIADLPYGCYKFCLIDCAQGQHDITEFITNGDFASGATGWTSQNATFAGGKARLTGGTSNWISQAISTTSIASCLEVQFDFDNVGEASVFIINIYIDDVLVDTVDTLGGDGSYSQTFNNVPAGAVIKIEYTDSAPFARVLDIDNVSVMLGVDCYLYDQCSNCFSYAAEFACTKMVEGYSDGNAFNLKFDNLAGVNIFRLSQRLKAELFNSAYNQEQSDYTFSTGVSSINYASSEKIKTLFVQPIPEYKHDVLALVRVCDHIFVDSIEYFSPKGEYTPEWNRSVLTDLAQSKIELKVKDQTLFNTNCS